MAVGRDAPRGLFHSTARALGVDFVSYLLGELACPTCGVVARSADPGVGARPGGRVHARVLFTRHGDDEFVAWRPNVSSHGSRSWYQTL